MNTHTMKTQRPTRLRELNKKAERDASRMTDRQHVEFMARNAEPASSYRQDNPFACLDD